MENHHEESNDHLQSNVIQIPWLHVSSDKCPREGCFSNRLEFMHFSNKEQLDQPLFKCRVCNFMFVCISYVNKCPNEGCNSTSVKFKYYNNSKLNQPRFKCNNCNKLYPYFKQRQLHPNGYKTGHVTEPFQYRDVVKTCDSITCKLSSKSDHKFYGCNNGDEKQPRYKCGNENCKRIFTPFKKARLLEDIKEAICDTRSSRSSSTENKNSAYLLHNLKLVTSNSLSKPTISIPIIPTLSANFNQNQHFINGDNYGVNHNVGGDYDGGAGSSFLGGDYNGEMEVDGGFFGGTGGNLVGGDYNGEVDGDYNGGIGGSYKREAGISLIGGNYNGEASAHYNGGVSGNYNEGIGGSYNGGAGTSLIGGDYHGGAGGDYNGGAGGDYNGEAGGNYNGEAGGDYNRRADCSYNGGVGSDYHGGGANNLTNGNYNGGVGDNYNEGVGSSLSGDDNHGAMGGNLIGRDYNGGTGGGLPDDDYNGGGGGDYNFGNRPISIGFQGPQNHKSHLFETTYPNSGRDYQFGLHYNMNVEAIQRASDLEEQQVWMHDETIAKEIMDQILQGAGQDIVNIEDKDLDIVDNIIDSWTQDK